MAGQVLRGMVSTMSSGQTTSLDGRIFQQIADHPAKSISFALFMELALYEPELGYYSDPARKVGRKGGDFYTSVSVGDTFGRLLAMAAAQCWRDLDRPESFSLIEQGAHDGQLALDILGGVDELDRDFATAVRYTVIEPRQAQRELLARRFSETAREVEIVAEASKTQAAGIFVCNELVDALPVHRVRWSGEQWCELRVAVGEGGDFEWVEAPIGNNMPLADEVARIDVGDFADGYTTEINLAAQSWMAGVSELFTQGQGRWWIIDYGHSDEEFFAAHRREGTLRCYREHRATDDPFAGVGETDITAHVNFSRLAEWAGECGLGATAAQGTVDQHDFLTRVAVDWLKALERGTADGTPMSATDQARVRQFQTLTHPGMMGRVFKFLELVN